MADVVAITAYASSGSPISPTGRLAVIVLLLTLDLATVKMLVRWSSGFDDQNRRHRVG
ncbi:hypothetical protein ACLK1S_26220 [Escherichia coli]